MTYICIFQSSVNLSNKLIIKDIGEIPKDDLVDENIEIPLTNEENSNIKGKDIMDYNIDDLINKCGLDS
jgi:hypothetical protein